MATKVSPKEQTTSSVESARARKGSQRVDASAMVDKDSFVSFKVPEWFTLICKENKPNGAEESADLWKPKKPTKAAKTEDENLPTPGTGTTGTRNIRKNPKGIPDDNNSTTFIGKKVKIYFGQATQAQAMKRGDKPYRHRSIRVHQAMNAMSVKYFLEKVLIDNAAISFAIGKTKYFLDGNTTLADLGSLRDDSGATTAP